MKNDKKLEFLTWYHKGSIKFKHVNPCYQMNNNTPLDRSRNRIPQSYLFKIVSYQLKAFGCRLMISSSSLLLLHHLDLIVIDDSVSYSQRLCFGILEDFVLIFSRLCYVIVVLGD